MAELWFFDIVFSAGSSLLVKDGVRLSLKFLV
jgi:hypothetical protein